MYILTEEPKSSGILMTEAFDAIDQVHGTEGFSKDQGIKAIVNAMDVGTVAAESLFRDLVNNGYVTPLTPSEYLSAATEFQRRFREGSK